MDVEIAAGDLSARLAQFLSDGSSCNRAEIGVHEDALVALLRHREGGREQACQDRKAKYSAVVPVHLVAEYGVPVRVEADHSVEIDCGTP